MPENNGNMRLEQNLLEDVLRDLRDLSGEAGEDAEALARACDAIHAEAVQQLRATRAGEVPDARRLLIAAGGLFARWEDLRRVLAELEERAREDLGRRVVLAPTLHLDRTMVPVGVGGEE